MKTIYLDHAASTPVKQEVKYVLLRSLEVYGNPSSTHAAGREARDLIKKTRETIAGKINCDPDEIHFTTGATMSNSVLFEGFKKNNEKNSFIVSVVEHNDLMSMDYDFRIQVGQTGRLRLDDLRYFVSYIPGRKLFSIQMANSETGVIQMTKRISEIIHEYENSYLHVDATQYIPYYPIDVRDMGIDALSMSGQKIGGVKGSGILYISRALKKYVSPVIYGEQDLIGGTPAIPLVASLGKAFELIDYDVEELKNKRDFLLEKLEEIGGILVGNREKRLPNNIYIRFPGIPGMTLMNLLDDYGICIGTGSACTTESDTPSHVALAYGLSKEQALECVRFSLGNENTYEDLEYTAQVVKGLVETLR